MIRGWLPRIFVSLQEAWAVYSFLLKYSEEVQRMKEYPKSVSSFYRIYMDLRSTRHSRRKWTWSICNIRVPVAVRFWDEKALSDPPKHRTLANSGATIAEENASGSALQIALSWPRLTSSRCLQHSLFFLNIGDKCLFEARHGQQLLAADLKQRHTRHKAGARPSKSESAFLSASACRYGSHSSVALHLKFNQQKKQFYHLLCASVPDRSSNWKMPRTVNITLRKCLNTKHY